MPSATVAPAIRRLDILVRDSREQTGNAAYSATEGVRQREFVRHANDAQTRIFNKICDVHPSLYTKEGFLDVTAGTASIALAADIYLRHNVLKIDFSANGDANNYTPLDLRTPRQEITSLGIPDGYFLRDGYVILTPKPSIGGTNALRLNYQYALPTLDIRRGKIASVALTGSALTTITLTDDTTLIDETADDLADGWVDYISVVDKDGAITAQNIPVTAYVAATRVISCAAALAVTETIVAGSYVVFGRYATTHSPLVQICERYISHYMSLLVQMRDSNSESADTNPLLLAIEQEILDSVESLEEDITAIPILDRSFLDYSEEI